MTSETEELRTTATRLLNEYEATQSESAYAEGTALLRRMIEEHPEDARLHLEYGYMQECRGRGSIRQATASYQRAIEIDPDYEKPRYQLAGACAALNETEHLIEMYKRRLAEMPSEVREYRFLAHAYLRAGEFDKASRVIASGRKLDPDDATLLSLEAEVLGHTGRRDEALELWSALKQRNPDDMSPYYETAFALEALGRFDEAIAEWRQIITWMEAHEFEVHTAWPTEMIEALEVKRSGGSA